MGNKCSSAGSGLSKTQHEAMCKILGKEMLFLCVEPAMANPELLVQVNVTKEKEAMDKAVVAIRKAADDIGNGDTSAVLDAAINAVVPLDATVKEGAETEVAAEVVEEDADDTAAPPKDEDGKADTDLTGTDKRLLIASLNGSASKLEKAIAAVAEADVATAAQDILDTYKDRIKSSFSMTMWGYDIKGASALVTAYQEDALCKDLLKNGVDWTVDGVYSEMKETIMQHQAVKNWKTAVEAYNQAMVIVTSAKVNDVIQMKGIDMKVTKLIIKPICKAIIKLMSKEELEIRKTPADRNVSHPEVFRKAYAGETLFISDFRALKSGPE